MTMDAFADRLARVRQRFVSTLMGKIDDAQAAVAEIAEAPRLAAAAVGNVYRAMHGIVGIGNTVGFPATGRAARAVEDILRPSYQHDRGLAAEQIASLIEALDELRAAAARELQCFHPIRN